MILACDWTTDKWACCTTLQPCEYGEGDCDNDGECAGSLVCGTNNCGGIFDSGADCCIHPPSKELMELINTGAYVAGGQGTNPHLDNA